jgi:hypothetical protein
LYYCRTSLRLWKDMEPGKWIEGRPFCNCVQVSLYGKPLAWSSSYLWDTPGRNFCNNDLDVRKPHAVWQNYIWSCPRTNNPIDHHPIVQCHAPLLLCESTSLTGNFTGDILKYEFPSGSFYVILVTPV